MELSVWWWLLSHIWKYELDPINISQALNYVQNAIVITREGFKTNSCVITLDLNELKPNNSVRVIQIGQKEVRV